MPQEDFDKTREALWGAPGFQVKRSTVSEPAMWRLHSADWIIETISTNDSQAIFLQWIGQDGGQRMVIPGNVAAKIYGHYVAIMKNRRKARSQHGAATRKVKTTQAPEPGTQA